MTDTISNPKNAGAFNLYDAPAAGKDESRFLLGQTSEGWSVSRRIDAVASAYTKLVADRKAEAPDNSPDFKVVELFWCGRTSDGSYILVPRGRVRAIPTKITTRSGKFKSTKLTGGALLDALFLGEDGADARDEAIWEALKALCEQERPDRRTLRELNDAVAMMVCLRAGIEVSDPINGLPQQHLRG